MYGVGRLNRYLFSRIKMLIFRILHRQTDRSGTYGPFRKLLSHRNELLYIIFLGYNTKSGRRKNRLQATTTRPNATAHAVAFLFSCERTKRQIAEEYNQTHKQGH